MKKGENGSMGLTVIAAMSALALTTYAVQQSARITNTQVNAVENERVLDKRQEAALNAAARLKALLAERKQANGSYKPALYAQNYFDFDSWNIKVNTALATNTSFALAGQAIRLNTAAKTANELALAQNVFKNTASGANQGTDSTTIEIEGINPSATNPFLAESADLSVKIPDGSGFFTARVRVPLPIPTPREPVLTYRLKSNPAVAFTPLTSNVDLPPGVYEFQARGSGIVMNAYITVDGERFDNLGLNGENAVHPANNYDADDVPIGPIVEVDFSGKSDFDETNCKMNTVQGNHKISMTLVGVDGQTRESTPTINFKTDSSAEELSKDQILGACTQQCPVKTVNEQHSAEFTHWYKTTGDGTVETPVGDMSGDWTWIKNEDFKITDKKICLNLDGLTQYANNGPAGDTAFWAKAKLYTYTIPGCKREFLIARSVCGCVAEDTLILLGDGKTQKRIDQIGPEDTIWNPLLKKALNIRHLSRGPEKIPMLKITVGGQELNVTGKHPFPTRSGMATAYSLNKGQEIMVEGSGWLPITNIVSVPVGDNPPIVWNIELEAPDDNWDAHHYVANGMVTGDLMIQAKLENNLMSDKD